MDSSSFLERISPNSISVEVYTEMVLCKLRRDIYEFLLRRKLDCEDEAEDEYNEEFDLTKYLRLITNEDIEIVISELQCAGWKTALAYGNTCLFIYVGDQPARVI